MPEEIKNITATESIQETADKGQEPAAQDAAAKTPKKTRGRSSRSAKSAGEKTTVRSREEVLREERQKAAERNRSYLEHQDFLVKWDALQSAMRNETILNGEIASISHLTRGEDTIVVAEIILENMFKAVIPFDEIYRDSPMDSSTEFNANTLERGGKAYRQYQMLRKLIGLNVPFLITYMDNEDHQILGSRKKAIAIIEEANYGGKKPVIEVGSTVNAEIISTGRHAVFLNVGGIDIKVNAPRLSFKYLPNCEYAYSVGQRIQVDVTNIIVKDDKRYVEVDARPVECRSAKMRRNIISFGANAHAVVSSVRRNPQNNRIYLTGWLPSFQMPIFANYLPTSALYTTVHPGDTILVTIRDMVDNGMVVCACRGIVSSGPRL